ncbi:hypothetical protein D9754_13125 [Planomicrobium sp. Y74]|nr:hypothetical protein D9754_13125 [Planomicrobium sp. Y74]
MRGYFEENCSSIQEAFADAEAFLVAGAQDVGGEISGNNCLIIYPTLIILGIGICARLKNYIGVQQKYRREMEISSFNFSAKKI